MRLIKTGLLAAGISWFGLGLPTASAAPESTDPIKITLNDWTGQLLSAHILGDILEKGGGYTVEYVPADYLAQFTGMRSGDLTVGIEVWATTAKGAMDEAIAAGGVENVGETGMQAIEDWWFPEYMKETCPGLPDWKALNSCAALFSTPETAPKGRYLGGPVTWGGYDEERVEALGLDYEVVHAGTDAALFAELKSAYERKAPVLLWIYAPHWAPIEFKGEWVKFPAYDPACYADPAWGENPDALYDCGKPRGPIYKSAWTGMKDKWPKAYGALKAYTFDNEMMGKLAARVDLGGETVEAVAADWVAQNEAVWKPWLGQ